MPKLEATGPVLSAVIDQDVAKENVTAVEATSGKRVRVLGYRLTSRAGACLQFHQGGASLSGEVIITANGVATAEPTGYGWFDTDVGNGLLFNTDAQVSGLIRYQSIN